MRRPARAARGRGVDPEAFVRLLLGIGDPNEAGGVDDRHGLVRSRAAAIDASSVIRARRDWSHMARPRCHRFAKRPGPASRSRGVRIGRAARRFSAWWCSAGRAVCGPGASTSRQVRTGWSNVSPRPALPPPWQQRRSRVSDACRMRDVVSASRRVSTIAVDRTEHRPQGDSATSTPARLSLSAAAQTWASQRTCSSRVQPW